MADQEDTLDTPDLGTDREGRKIVYRHILAAPVVVYAKPTGKAAPTALAEASEFQFREPTGMDIAMFGLPAKLVFADDGTYTVEVVEAKMGAMMSGLMVSDDPPPLKAALVRQLPSNDWTACAYALARFFTPAMPSL